MDGIPRRLALLAIISLGILTWIPGVLDAAFVWDDDQYVTENRNLESLEALGTAMVDLRALPQYYPLTHVSFFVERSLFGLEPSVFRATNMVLHICSALLLYLLLVRLRLPAALLAALLFCLHPVQCESVLWITERKNTLSLFFMLLALGRLLARDEGPDRKDLILGFLFFVLALASKSVACATPAVYLLLCVLRYRITRRDVLIMLPFFALGLLSASLTGHLEREHVGAVGREFAFSFLERCVIAGRALFFYSGKLLLPWPLSFNYERWEIGTGISDLLWPILALVLVASLVAARKRLGRGLLVGCLIYGGLLVPALGFVNVYPMRYSFVADHFQYHASPALLAVIAGLLAFMSRRLPPRAALVLPALLVLACMALTWLKTPAWASPEALWLDTIRNNPDSFLALHNLGDQRRSEGDLEDALRLHQEALSKRPDLGALWTEVAIDLEALGQPEAALEHFEAAHAAEPERSGFALNLALALLRRGRAEDGMKVLEELDAAALADPVARGVRGATLMARGRWSEALRDLEIAVAVETPQEDDILNLSIAIERLRGAESALEALPDSSSRSIRIRRAELLLASGKRAAALALAEEIAGDSADEARARYIVSYLLCTRRGALDDDDLRRLEVLHRELRERPSGGPHRLLAEAALAARLGRFEEALSFVSAGLLETRRAHDPKRRALFESMLELYGREQVLYLW